MLKYKRVILISILLLIVVFFSFYIFSFYKIKIWEFRENCVLLTAFFKSKTLINSPAEKKFDFPKYPFISGEKLKYNIYSSGIKVGVATITYLGEKEVNDTLVSCIIVEARAPGFYDLDKIYGNIKDYTPVRVEREVRLFGNQMFITEEYDKNDEVLITHKSKAPKVTRIKSQGKISNIILLLYHFRYKKGYAVGDSLNFNLPTRKLNMIVDKKTTIKIAKGKFESIFVKSLPPQFKVWFRSDTDNIPLRIQGAIGFGNTYLELTDVE